MTPHLTPMNATPKANRLTIALAGKANVGKSTLLNLIAGQEVAIVSPIAGTTTDVVEKAMELLPFGPVLWLDTGGWDDATILGDARRARTAQALARADIVLGVAADTAHGVPDPDLIAFAAERSRRHRRHPAQALDRLPGARALPGSAPADRCASGGGRT